MATLMINEFVSQLETIMKAEELLFEATPGFGRYKQFLEHAIAHPAKMNTALLEFLIKKFTKTDDVVLDPMCGTGSTGLVSALLRRNAVCVDLEQKFVDWAEEAKHKMQNAPSLTPKGKILNICGDARKLSELLKETDVVLTSPPYSEGIGHDSGDNASKQFSERLKMQHRYTRQMTLDGNIAKLKHGDIDVVLTSPPFSKDVVPHSSFRPGHEQGVRGYSESKSNISNLPLVSIDAIVTSPPYAIDPKNVCHTKPGKTLEEYDEKRGFKPTAHQRTAYSTNPDNIGHLPEGNIDAVITSPPYADSKKGDEDEARLSGNLEKFGLTEETRRERHTPGRLRATKSMVSGYSKTPENIGNLPLGNVDAIVTSPPYASSLTKHNTKTEETVKQKLGSAYLTPGRLAAQKRMQGGYSDKTNEKNIGNLSFVDQIITSPPYSEGLGHGRGPAAKKLTEEKKIHLTGAGSYSQSKENIGEIKKHETYLEAMLKVYSEMFKVLKPNGLAIIVIKPFIRNKKVVDLPFQTWLLLEKVGFKLARLYKLRLMQESFWRVIYHKKHKGVPKLAHEYILICQKKGVADATK